MPKPTIVRGAKAKALKPVHFAAFDRKPTNYFRGMIQTDSSAEPEASPTNTLDLAREIGRAREQFQSEAESRTRRAVDEAILAERNAAQGELKKAIDLLNGYVRIMRAQLDEWKQKMERQSVELAFEIAGKVISQELATRPDVVADMVKEAVQQLTDITRLTIRVHPDDLELIRAAAKKWQHDGDISTQADIKPDSSLQRGDSLIESDRGITDARVSSQIARLKSEASSGA